jgi:hypothetical protein
MKRQALFFSTITVVMLNQPTFAADGASAILEVRGAKTRSISRACYRVRSRCGI